MGLEVSPEEWIPILVKTYDFIRASGVGDLAIYGSQTLSLHMARPLSSKNIDLVGTVGISLIQQLSRLLAEKERFEVRKTETGYVYTVYARTETGRPIIVEVFTATSLGPLATLTKHVIEVKRWGGRFWTLTPAAYAAAKLASPHPLTARDAERINLALEISSADAIAEVLSETGRVSKARERLIEAKERGLPLNDNLARKIVERNARD